MFDKVKRVVLIYLIYLETVVAFNKVTLVVKLNYAKSQKLNK